MKLKLKIFLASLVAFFLFCIIYCLVYGDSKYGFTRYYVRTDCGIVTSNFTELANVKHGTRTDYYIKVKYPSYEKIQHVNAETFYSRGVGDNVCFDIFESLPLWISMGGMIGVVICALCSIGLFLSWILDLTQ